MEKKPESTHLIRFQDCDPFGHLNNARYIDYFMSAREDHARDYYNLDVYKIAKETGKSWVVGQNQIAYFKEASLMEEVIIQSQIIHYSDKSISVECHMYDRNKTQLKALLWATFVHVNIRKAKSEAHSEDHMKLFKTLTISPEVKLFDDRVKSIRNKMLEKAVS